jgi:hypothetical protein
LAGGYDSLIGYIVEGRDGELITGCDDDVVYFSNLLEEGFEVGFDGGLREIAGVAGNGGRGVRLFEGGDGGLNFGAGRRRYGYSSI